MKGIEGPFPCLGMEWLGGNAHSSLFPQNLKFFFPSKLGGMGWNEFRFNEIFVKTPKIPI